LRRVPVDASIVHIVETYMTNAKFLARGFARLKTERAPDNTAKREAEFAGLKAKRARLLDGFEDGLISKADYSERIARIETALRAVETLLPAAPPPMQEDSRAKF
jgi:hypothetical protein